MIRKAAVLTLIAAFASAATPGFACTGISLKAQDGSAIRGRTLEFGFPMQSNVLVIPAGKEMSGTLPDGGKGLVYTSRYAIVGANALGALLRRGEASGTLHAHFSTQGEKIVLPADVESELLRIAQEAMTNIRRHAHADRVDISLKAIGKSVEFAIADDGSGFDNASLQANPQRGIGLRNMHERADAVGGLLAIASAPGNGTRIAVTVKGA